ncbi:ROK family protein [Iamia sp. SCSIO 61187]|uniref:ROK family protein n=1 Tax=Iamia sp. SCSIO 61187 TaxID=2722752 RepID=UPI001C62AD6A|nr:ROK family protein [Iamia sp. SCSIO 61187]QYG91352.1 ROK family protein [Iamia sp. SCSIO 61187]
MTDGEDGGVRTIGVDLGGTKVLAARVAPDGSVRDRVKRPTPTDGPQAVAAAIAEMVAELGGADRLGVGTPGYVDADGVVAGVPNLVGWEPPVPLRDILRAAVGLDHVVVDNDVNAGTLAEAAHGAAAGRGDVLCAFMGTGVGGGLILDGQLRRGPRGLAGEIGHVTVQAGGRRCGCGGRGHMEAYAGRIGMEGEARRRHAAGEETALVDLAGDGRMKSGTFAKALDRGDRIAAELLTEAVDAVAVAIASTVMLVDVTTVVVGGGVADKLGPPFVARIEEAVATHLGPALPVAVLPAALGDDAGAIGAARLAAPG